VLISVEVMNEKVLQCCGAAVQPQRAKDKGGRLKVKGKRRMEYWNNGRLIAGIVEGKDLEK